MEIPYRRNISGIRAARHGLLLAALFSGATCSRLERVQGRDAGCGKTGEAFSAGQPDQGLAQLRALL
jgi:hypothetical protein